MRLIKIINQFNSFKNLNKQLEKYTKNNQTKLAGDIFELVVKLYLQTNPKYKTKLKKVWLLKEVDKKIKHELNLPDEDEGIDLIAETFDKRYWAIQAKYRSNSKETLTLSGSGGLATFNSLAFNYCKNISHGLVCTTVEKPPKKIKLLKSVGFETLDNWLALDDDNKDGWKNLIAKSKGKLIKPKPFKPKPHQISAIHKTIKHFKKNDRGKILMPCGTGKSLAAFWIFKKIKAKKVLVAVPSLALLQQTLKVWTRELLIQGINADWLCVCSDISVKENQDDFISYTYDLGIEVTTNPNHIRKFLAIKNKKIKIIFTTYQSGNVTARGSKGHSFDLGIMDEAHKTVGYYDKLMAHLLSEKNIKIKKRLFMTATERLFRKKNDEYLSMDNVNDYGKIIFQLSFKKAIETKPPIISDYKVLTFDVMEPDIKEIYKSNKYLKIKKDLKNITARELATAISLRKAIKKLKIKNAISFHSTVERAKNFMKQQELITKNYSGYKPIKSFHVSGSMPTNERSSYMRSFAENGGLMTNARCLTEGVDLPAVDCICFTDPKRSKIDIVQAAGRCLRLSKGKKFGYILIPIIVPKNEDPNETAKGTAFEEIVTTVGALSSQDTRIKEYLKCIENGSIPTGGSPIDGITRVNSLTKVNPRKFEKSIKLKIWDKIAQFNFMSYEEAEKFTRSLKLRTFRPDYMDFVKTKKRPKDLPTDPYTVYKNSGWIDAGTYIGHFKKAWSKIEMANFEDVKKFIRKNNITTSTQWFEFCDEGKNPINIPRNLYRTYKNKGWKGWGDLTGTGNTAFFLKNYRPFEKAREFARSLNLKNQKEWFKFTKNKKIFPKDLPVHPGQSEQYVDKWSGWQDFLGNDSRYTGEYLSFVDASTFVKKLGIKTSTEYTNWAKTDKKPQDIPYAPWRTYRKEWKSWPHFLGIEKLTNLEKQNLFPKFSKAKKIVSKFKLKTMADYRKKIKDENLILPTTPNRTYAKNWKSTADYLGQKRGSVKFLNFVKARLFVRKLGLKTYDEYREYKNKSNFPAFLPQAPDNTYKNKGWRGWKDFIGTE